ncbi:MAG: ketoacyl-ACP synthase III [Actinomycetota bacterium]|nr:ketoacyl-ACP synthase III [Actinomycetota bacterium]MCL6092974.1 ketoacyl-ACP synthase III [Actinomycetota bacterium]MDA8167694.1 ketoacyl-ACP synthase III [Actinomycetota bacterium]
MSSRRAKISAVGTFVPQRVVTNDDLSLELDTSDEWISTRTGIRERRIAENGEAASDLGARAARRVLEAAGVAPGELDLIIVASLSPDMLFPSTASLISGAIGAEGTAAFDLSAACTGFIYALSVANAFIVSGQADRVLVIGAEVVSKMIDWSDRATAVLFGDGAGAVLLEPAADGEEGIIGFDLGNDPAGAGELSLPAGGSRLPASEETVAERLHFLRMNGREVFRFATRVIQASSSQLLERSGHRVEDVDIFVPHQANIRIIDAAARKLGIPPEKVFSNLERYGNTSCASIPLCLDEAEREGRLKKGDLVLMVGFGGGLSWGSCLMRW